MNEQSALSCLRGLIGLPFVYGGRGPEAYDCWGLVQECHRRWHGVELPDYRSSSEVKANAALMHSEGERLWARLPAIGPGAVLLLRIQGVGAHVGFVHSPTRFLQAMEKTGVTESRLAPFQRMIIGAYEYVGPR